MNSNAVSNAYQDLDSREFQLKLSETPNAILLDVRTGEEFKSERIPGSINLNVMDSSFLEKVSALDRSKTYFVYCRSGGRSGSACSVMAKQGFEVFNLAGGILHWSGEFC